jgi:hypothetical protein
MSVIDNHFFNEKQSFLIANEHRLFLSEYSSTVHSLVCSWSSDPFDALNFNTISDAHLFMSFIRSGSDCFILRCFVNHNGALRIRPMPNNFPKWLPVNTSIHLRT